MRGGSLSRNLLARAVTVLGLLLVAAGVWLAWGVAAGLAALGVVVAACGLAVDVDARGERREVT